MCRRCLQLGLLWQLNWGSLGVAVCFKPIYQVIIHDLIKIYFHTLISQPGHLCGELSILLGWGRRAWLDLGKVLCQKENKPVSLGDQCSTMDRVMVAQFCKYTKKKPIALYTLNRHIL